MTDSTNKAQLAKLASTEAILEKRLSIAEKRLRLAQIELEMKSMKIT
jgi:uncharacterized membrane protein YqjE